MVTITTVEKQLKDIGCSLRFWWRPEIRELANTLMADELIAGCVNGHYTGGSALLVVTNHRLLLIDRKPMFLTVEDIRFDMIAEIDYNARLLNSTVFVVTPTRKLAFSSRKPIHLRKILDYTQQRVMEIRQHFLQRQFTPAQPNAQAYAADPQVTASMVGELAMQSNTQHMLPMNPYSKVPLLTRRRRYPRFYN